MADQLSSDLASLRIQREENPQAARSRRALILYVVLGIAALAVVFIGFRMLSARVFRAEVDVTEIRMVSPSQGSTSVSSTGYVIPQISSTVGAKLTGRVAEVKVREGSAVKAGDVLVRLEDAEQKTAVAGARARVLAAKARAQTARANLAETRRQFERERDLMLQGASARSLAEDLEARVKSLEELVNAADADVGGAQAELDALQVNLGYTIITTPIDGVVIGKPVDAGEMVGPVGDPIAEIADFTSLMVETDVTESRLNLIREQGPAEIILDAYPTRRFRGQVTEISPRVNRAKATVVVKVKFMDDTQGVLPEMAARVSFLAKELAPDDMKEPPRLFVPGSAVTERNGNKVVFELDEDNKVRMSPVTLGPPMGNGFELRSGPVEGTRVVANPPSTLSHGQSIKEKNQS